MQLRSGPLLIKATPLAEEVIRLMAPDTYDRLHALAESRRTEAAQGTIERPELFLVSFFSYEPGVAFTPEDSSSRTRAGSCARRACCRSRAASAASG